MRVFIDFSAKIIFYSFDWRFHKIKIEITNGCLYKTLSNDYNTMNTESDNDYDTMNIESDNIGYKHRADDDDEDDAKKRDRFDIGKNVPDKMCMPSYVQLYSSFIEYHVDKYLETHEYISMEELQRIITYFHSLHENLNGYSVSDTHIAKNYLGLFYADWYSNFDKVKLNYIDNIRYRLTYEHPTYMKFNRSLFDDNYMRKLVRRRDKEFNKLILHHVKNIGNNNTSDDIER